MIFLSAQKINGYCKMIDTKEWEAKLEKRLVKLLEFLKYKNHGFCIKYLNNIIKDFFKNKKKILKK